ARDELKTGARLTVMQYLRVLMVYAADAVPAVLPDDGKPVAFREALDGVADVAQVCARPDCLDTVPHRLVTGAGKPAGEDARVPDEVHPAGVAVKAVADHGDVDVDDIAALQALV